MRYSEPLTYKNYEIYIDPATNKYGIRNIQTDYLVVKCIFDRITLHPRPGIFVFKLNDKEAVWHADKIQVL
jgi:hypothetical protein